MALLNYYDILGLNFFESNQTTIRKAYQALTEKYHPNSYKGEDIKERLIEINEAFLVLSDKKTKELYDESLTGEGSKLSEEEFNNLIGLKHERAERFVNSYFNGTQKKRKWGFWKIFGVILLILFILGIIGRIITAAISDGYSTPSGNVTKLNTFVAPSSWSSYTIDNSLTIDVPPTLELRSEYDKYSKIIASNQFNVSNADAIFQQVNLGKMDEDALDDYCRVMVARYYLGPGEAEHSYESPALSVEDYSDLRDIADQEVIPWHYVETPSFKWLEINNNKCIDISYIRTGAKGNVTCHIYLFFNYDELAKVITAYRVADAKEWSQDVNDIIKTFKWKHAK